MLGEAFRQLIEVVGELDLAAQRPEGINYGAAALHRDQPGDGVARALDDDFLAALGKGNEPRELTLGFMHSDVGHTHTVTDT